MSSKGKDEIYTCVGILLLILAIGLYVVYTSYGLLPFVLGGFFVAVFAAWAIYSSHKAKHTKPQTKNTQPPLTVFQQATPQEREKLLESAGFTKTVDENGNSRWRAPKDGLPDWTKNEKIDVIMENGSVHVEMEKETPKIRCSFCGTIYDSKLDKCPNCGASRRGDEEAVPD
jgi:hypothetical protein